MIEEEHLPCDLPAFWNSVFCRESSIVIREYPSVIGRKARDREPEPAERARPGLARADRRPEPRAAERAADEIGPDVRGDGGGCCGWRGGRPARRPPGTR